MKLDRSLSARRAGNPGARGVMVRLWIMIGALTLAFSTSALSLRSAVSPAVSVSVEPSTIALGQAAQLSVTVSGNAGQTPELPSISGLQIVPLGRSTSMESINGKGHSTTSYLYRIQPSREGTFTLPSIDVGGGRTAPVVLKVLQKAAGTGTGLSSAGTLFPPPLKFIPPQNPGSGSDDEQMAFLRVLTPKHRLYVGEMVPVTVKAYFRAGLNATLNGLPILSSDAFTLNQLGDEPDETTEMVNGTPYTVLTWTSALSAVKAGDYSVDLELPLLVRVRARSSHANNPFRGMVPPGLFDDSFFDDAFFDDFFGGVHEKPVTLQTEPLKLQVAPLPAAGRPADFTGAVGQFTLSSEAAPTSVAAGDPVTLKIEVSGSGNFDRVTLPGLQDSDLWKSYRINADFHPTDSAGYEGTKTFEQAIVPRRVGSKRVPAIHFSYFDPERGEYVKRTTKPISVTINGAADNLAAASVQPVSDSGDNGSRTSLAEPSLAPDKASPGRGIGTLRPVFLSPWFVGVQGLILFAAAGAWGLLRLRERRLSDPVLQHRRSVRAIVAERLAQMDAAVRAGNATAFFITARDALRERLASCWHIPTTAVTISEIDRRLDGSGRALHELFALADRAAYAGLPPGAQALAQWKAIVEEQLKRMEAV